MPKFYKPFLGCLFILLLFNFYSKAQIVLSTTANSVVSENFNLFTSAGPLSGSPTGWYSSSSNGSYKYVTSGSGNTGGLYIVDNPTGDKCIGGLTSGTSTSNLWGVVLKNSTGYSITEWTIKYTGEQWRSFGSQTLAFEYYTSTSAITSVSPGTFTGISALGFTALTTSSGAATDGNNASYRTVKNSKQSITLASGSSIEFRWNKSGSSSPLLCSDDLFITYQPVVQPTVFATSSVTQTSATVSWTAAAVSPTGYIVFRNTGTTSPSFSPVDGTTYTTGTTYGTNNDKCVYIGSSTTFNETGLSAGTKYSYIVYAYNGSSDYTNYLQSSPLSGNYTTVTPSAVNNPTNFLALRNSTSQINLTWTLNANSNNVMVVASPSLGIVASPTDKTIYKVGDSINNIGTVIYKGNSTSFSHTLLKSGTLYKYKIYSISTDSLYSFGAYDDEPTYRNYSVNTDYFRTANSIDTGSWYPGNTGIWESSEDNSYWISSTLVPDVNSALVTIQNNDTIRLRMNVGVTKLKSNTGSYFSIPSNRTLTLASTTGANWNSAGSVYINSALTIPSTFGITISGTDTFRIKANLTNAGTITVNAGNMTTDSLITLVNSGTISNNSGLIIFKGGSTYQHALTGGAIPTAIWKDNSTCLVTGMTSGVATNYGQSFYNLTFNCASNSGFSNNLNANMTVRGKLYFQNTAGTGATIGLFGPGASGNYTVNVTGDVEVAAGQYVTLNNQNSPITGLTMNIGGNLIIGNGAYFRFSFRGSNPANVPVNVNLKGNLNIGSSILFDGSGGSSGNASIATLTFTGLKLHKLLGNSIPSPAYAINYVVNKLDTLDFGSLSINGIGTFTSNNLSAIKFNASTNGLTTSLPITGTKTFSTLTSFIVQATGTGQVTNLGLGGTGYAPASIKNLILLGNGVTNTINLNNDIVVDDTLKIKDYYGFGLNGKQLKLNGTYLDSNGASLIGSITSSLVVNGTTSSLALPSSLNTLNNLTINRSGGVILNGDLSVNSALTFTSGILNTKNASTLNTITLGSSGTLTETSTSYLIGKIKTTRNLNPSTLESFGGLGVGITTTGSTNAGSTEVIRTTGNSCGAASVCYSQYGKKYSGIHSIWKITPTNNGNLNATLAFSYNETHLNGIWESNLSIFRKRDNGNGNFYRRHTLALNTTANTISTANNDSMSEWTLGGTTNPSPVEWLNFTAQLMNQNAVLLNWSTATEINNDYFDVQKSTDGIDWVTIAKKEASSYPNQVNNYSLVDNQIDLTSKIIYYRIKQVDYNGDFEYSTIEKVNLNSIAINEVKTWFDGNNIRIIGGANKLESVQLFDLSGRLILNNQIYNNRLDYDISNYKQGLYLIQMYFEDGTIKTCKVLKY